MRAGVIAAVLAAMGGEPAAHHNRDDVTRAEEEPEAGGEWNKVLCNGTKPRDIPSEEQLPTHKFAHTHHTFAQAGCSKYNDEK
jgi:hypothetical protein